MPVHPLNEERVERFGYRKLKIVPTELLGASKGDANKYQAEHSTLGIPPHPRGKNYRAEDLLTPHMCMRLEDHRNQTFAVRQRAEVPLPMQVWNISQTPAHHPPSPHSSIPQNPALTTPIITRRVLRPRDMSSDHVTCPRIASHIL